MEIYNSYVISTIVTPKSNINDEIRTYLTKKDGLYYWSNKINDVLCFASLDDAKQYIKKIFNTFLEFGINIDFTLDYLNFRFPKSKNKNMKHVYIVKHRLQILQLNYNPIFEIQDSTIDSFLKLQNNLHDKLNSLADTFLEDYLYN